MSGDVCEELERAKRCIQRGLYCEALAAITAAEKAWQIECDLWADALHNAEGSARTEYAKELLRFADTYKELQ